MRVTKSLDGVLRTNIRITHRVGSWDLAGAWAKQSYGDEKLPTTRDEVMERLRDVLGASGSDGVEYGFDNWEGAAEPLEARIVELFPELATA